MIIINKKFSSFFWTQFLGAFNDNFLKNALVVMVTYQGATLGGLESHSLVALASGLFILPFFLFSTLTGQFADKFEKSKLIRLVKLAEIFIMLIAAFGFFVESYSLLFFTLFLMGTHSAVFGPLKFSIIPELVTDDEMTKGNAFVELGTFMAILLGTIAGGFATTLKNSSSVISGGLLFIAVVGYIISRLIPAVPIADSKLKIEINPLYEFRALFKLINQKLAIFNSIFAISWFWFFGIGILSVLPVYCRDLLGVNEQVVTIFLAAFTLGIGVGSILCERLSFKRVEIGLVPIGSLGLTIFLFDLYLTSQHWTISSGGLYGISEFFAQKNSYRLIFDFLMMSISGGIFIVPLYTLLQERSDVKSRSRVIAANNILNALFMVASSITVALFYNFDLNSSQIFLVFALMNMAVAFHVYRVVPEFTLRLCSWILSHVMYKIKVTGREHIPLDGPILLAGNHVSFIDWLIISGACKRPARFVMHYRFFEIPLLKTFFRQAKVIPIAGRSQDESIMNTAFETVSSELRDNQVICIFPEGRISQDGQLSPFRPGIIKILEKDPCPVVPFVIRNLWGSIFSRSPAKTFSIIRRSIELEFFPSIKPQDFQLEKFEALIKSELGKKI